MISNQNGAGSSFSPWVRSAKKTAWHLESDEHDEHQSLREKCQRTLYKNGGASPKTVQNISSEVLALHSWEVQNLEMSMKKKHAPARLYCFRKCFSEITLAPSPVVTLMEGIFCNLVVIRCVPSFAPQVLMPPVEKPSSTPFFGESPSRSNHSQWMLCTYPTLSLRTTDGPQKTPFNLCTPWRIGFWRHGGHSWTWGHPGIKIADRSDEHQRSGEVEINLQKCQRLRSIRYDCVQFVA